MKRIISLILCLTFLACSLTAFAASFTDFDSSHWAASYVNELVADGTVERLARVLKANNIRFGFLKTHQENCVCSNEKVSWAMVFHCKMDNGSLPVAMA